MQRNLNNLVNLKYDVVIIGGGIFGVCAAWDAVTRGLSVALLEKEDFSHAASANHFKIAHGGIRYLQHGDIYRVRESSRERAALLRIAPHLVSPLPIVIPTYGHGLKGKTVLKAGMALYDLLTIGRNRDLQRDKAIPPGSFLSREDVLNLFPGIQSSGLTAGAVFSDGQMYSPPRLAMSFLKSATQKGMVAANYVKVDGFLREKNKICGVTAKDLLGGNELDVHAKMVLNTSGPWAHLLNRKKLNIAARPIPTFSRDLALVIKKRPQHEFGLALTTKTGDADSIIDRGGRHLFMVPWRDRILIGVWHKVIECQPENIAVTDRELEEFIGEINSVYPSLQLSISDIAMVNTGLTLFGSKNDQGKLKISFGKRSRIIDHTKEHQLDGLLTMIGVRATMARGMAEKAVDLIFKKFGKIPPRSKTAYTPIYGGDFVGFEQLVTGATRQYEEDLGSDVLQSLLKNYGSKFDEVTRLFDTEKILAQKLDGTHVIRAEIVHAVREEMAQKMSDVVFRRTDLGTAGYPGEKALNSCLKIMTEELEWNEKRAKQEYIEVQAAFNNLRNNAYRDPGVSQ